MWTLTLILITATHIVTGTIPEMTQSECQAKMQTLAMAVAATGQGDVYAYCDLVI